VEKVCHNGETLPRPDKVQCQKYILTHWDNYDQKQRNEKEKMKECKRWSRLRGFNKRPKQSLIRGVVSPLIKPKWPKSSPLHPHRGVSFSLKPLEPPGNFGFLSRGGLFPRTL
jgi:hypothetical protein